MARRSSRLAVQPVGLAGELTTSARVRAVTASLRRSISSVQPAAPLVIGTATGRAPATVMAPWKFGQAGVGMRTSSPVPAAIRTAIWAACMPPTVTEKRSTANGLR